MFTPDGKYLEVKGYNDLLEAASGHTIRLAETPYAWLGRKVFGDNPAFSEDGKFFFQRPDAMFITSQLFEAPKPDPREFSLGHECVIESAAFAKEGHNLLVGCSNGGLRLLDLHSLDQIRSFGGAATDLGDISDSSLSRNGDRIFTGVSWWDLNIGSLGGRLPIMEGRHASYAISPDGHLGVTSGHDQPPKVWPWIGVFNLRRRRWIMPPIE
jgi:WD40 repeat protein